MVDILREQTANQKGSFNNEQPVDDFFGMHELRRKIASAPMRFTGMVLVLVFFTVLKVPGTVPGTYSPVGLSPRVPALFLLPVR